METTTDYYELLGVARDASAQDIKKAFRRKARELHPDVSSDPDAEEKFRAVNEAYSVLSDEAKRSNYDRFGNPDGPVGFGGAYTDISDIFGGGGFGFGSIFEDFFGGSQSTSVRTAGRDMMKSLLISLEEAAAGCKKTITFERLTPCEACHAQGTLEPDALKICDTCHGSGVVVELQRTILGTARTQHVCPHCHGQKTIVDKPCEVCHGEGRHRATETLEISVPAGIQSGQTLRVSGKGEAGLRGDASGDLMLTIEIAPHERFERHGSHLSCVCTIDVLEALVGTTRHMQGILPDEDIVVEIDPQVQYGDQLRLTGYGMPDHRTHLRGDLIVTLKVETPDDVSQEDLNIIREMVERRSAREQA